MTDHLRVNCPYPNGCTGCVPTELEPPPRCQREHRLEVWPYTRRCEGEATDTVQLDDGTELAVCGLCKIDAAEGQHLDVVQDGEEE